jgi:hypothetical protein
MKGILYFITAINNYRKRYVIEILSILRFYYGMYLRIRIT